MESGRYVLIGLLVLGLVAGVYYFFGPTDQAPEVNGEQDRQSSEQELSDFTLNENLSGNELWRIRAPAASRSGDTVELQSPNVVYTVDGDTRVTIVADLGYYSLKTNRLVLVDNVRIERTRQSQILTTDRLKWNRQERIISTESPVKVEMPHGTLTARGMETRLKEDTVQFDSNVKYSSK